MNLKLRAAAALLATSLSEPVSAATILYTLSGAASAEFSIEQRPRPDQVYTTGFRLIFVEGYFWRAGGNLRQVALLYVSRLGWCWRNVQGRC